jgi:hypothetical protein
MKYRLLLVLSLAAWLEAGAQDLRGTLFREADTALEIARAARAESLAPGTFERALELYAGAEQDLSRGRNIERIRSSLGQAEDLFGAAAEAAEIASVTLASLIKTRDDAASANAATFAPDMWVEAEEVYDSAARRLETGDIRGARGRSEEAEALYRDAELTAI